MSVDKKKRVLAQTVVRKGNGTVSVSPEVAGTLTAGTGTLLFVRKSDRQNRGGAKLGPHAD